MIISRSLSVTFGCDICEDVTVTPDPPVLPSDWKVVSIKKVIPTLFSKRA